MSPEELLEQLKKDASGKVQQSLDAIYDICKEQQERGIQEFSIATISKLGYKRGVPLAQSIRNTSGVKYRALIQTFADAASQGKKTKKLSKQETDWVTEVENPKHQLLIRIMASELKEAQQMVREIIPPKQRIDIYDHKNIDSDETFRLTEQEIRALEYLLSNDFQKKWNFTQTKYGELVDENQIPVFKVATLDAIRKALEHLT